MKAAEGMVAGFGKSVLGVAKSIVSPMNILAGGLSAGAMTAGIKRSMSAVDALAKQADALGMSTEGLAGLQHAAGLAGASMEKLGTALRHSNRFIGEAATGNKAAADRIERLGLSIQALQEMRPDQRFRVIADTIRGMSDQTERAAASAALLGEGASYLMPLILGGSAAMDAASREAERFGLAVSRVDAAKIEAANDAFSKIGKVISGVFNQLAISVAPFIEAFSNAITGAAGDVTRLGDITDTFVRWAIKAVGPLADAWQGLRIAWSAIQSAILDAANGFVLVYDGMVQGAQWVGEKVSAVWDRIGAGMRANGAVVNGVWLSIRTAVAAAVNFMSNQLAGMMDKASEAMRRIKGMMDEANAMQAAAFAMRRTSSESMVALARDREENAKDARKAWADIEAANTRLFGSFQATGSEFARQLAAAFRESREQAKDEIGKQTEMGAASQNFREALNTIKIEAQQRAEARAAEVEAQQAHNSTLLDIEADHLAQREEQQLAWWSRMINAAAYQNTQKTVAGFSAMFANLEKLQGSHSKKARKIGDAAAKARIVTDTATAAMASFQSLAGIPIVGPALGAAAAAAAVAAGAVQLQQVGKSTVGGGPTQGGPGDVSVGNVGGIATPNMPTSGQSRPMMAGGGTDSPGRLVIDSSAALDPSRLAAMVNEAGRAGFVFDGIDLR